MANFNIQQCKDCAALCICRPTVNPNGPSCKKFAELVVKNLQAHNKQSTPCKNVSHCCSVQRNSGCYGVPSCHE
jgi:hypothetical protein